MSQQSPTQPLPPPPLNQKKNEGERWELLWGVRRSIRYHDRRRGFFITCHRVVLAFGIVAASIGMAVANGVAGEGFLRYASVMALLAFLIDLVADFSSKAWLHTDLKRRFGDLEVDIVSLPDEDQDIRPYWARRLKIEKDEPRVMRALDLLCHNELAKSKGINDDIYRVSCCKKWTAQFLNWENIELSKCKPPIN